MPTSDPQSPIGSFDSGNTSGLTDHDVSIDDISGSTDGCRRAEEIDLEKVANSLTVALSALKSLPSDVRKAQEGLASCQNRRNEFATEWEKIQKTVEEVREKATEATTCVKEIVRTSVELHRTQTDLTKAMTELQSQTLKFEDQRNQNQTKFDAALGLVEVIEKEVPKLSTKRNSLKRQLEEIESDMSEARKRAKRLPDEVQELHGEVQELHGEVQQLHGEVGKLQTQAASSAKTQYITPFIDYGAAVGALYAPDDWQLWVVIGGFAVHVAACTVSDWCHAWLKGK
jgi:chromosome segregation ATPase